MKRPKVKSDSLLKNLPEERRDQIAEWCAKVNDRDGEGKIIPRTGGLAYAQEQLAADGIKLSLPTLSEFYSWWQLGQDLDTSFLREEQVLEKTGDVKKAREAGEALLIRLGLAKGSPDLIALGTKIHDQGRALDLEERSAETRGRQADAKIAQKDRDLALTERRVSLLETNAAKAKEQLEAVKKAGGLSPETLRQIEEAAKLL